MQIEIKIKTITFILILLLITILFHIIEFRVASWNIDEFIFAAGGQKLLAGGTLYKDFGDNKPPLIYYTYALFYWIAQKQYMPFFIVAKTSTIAIVFLIGSCFYCIGKNLGSRTLGMVSGLLYAAYSIGAPGPEVLGGRTELYASFMAIISIYFFSRKKFAFSIVDMISSGIFLSLAALYNTRFGIIFAAYLAFIVYKHAVSKRSMLIITVLIASFVPLLAAVPIYYYRNGTFEYYTFWQSTVLKHYLNALPIYFRILAGFLLLAFFIGNAPLVVFAVHYAMGKIRKNIRLSSVSANESMNRRTGRLGAAASRLINASKAIMMRDPGNEAFVFQLLILLFAYGAFFAGGIPGIRYFYLMYIPICFFSAQGVLDVFQYVREKSSVIEISGLLKIILVLFLICAPAYYFSIHWNTRRPTVAESIETYRQVVDYIKEHVHHDQKIYVWSDMHPIYLYSDRIMATSMVYPSEFLGRYYYYTGNFRKDVTAWDLFLKQLDEERPELILDNTGNFSTWKGVLYYKKNKFIDTKIDELRSYIKENYTYTTELSGYKIYRKK
jgi:hypothetical protein